MLYERELSKCLLVKTNTGSLILFESALCFYFNYWLIYASLWSFRIIYPVPILSALLMPLSSWKGDERSQHTPDIAE